MGRKWVVAGWATAAVVAGAAGVGAVALAQGGSLAPPTEPTSEESVMAMLEEQSQTPGTGSPSPSGSPTPGAEPTAPPTGLVEEAPSGDAGGGEVFAVDGGTFSAGCADGLVTLDWWSPAQGWQVSNVDQGPTDEAEIEFEGPSGEAEYTLTCVNGVPTADAPSGGDDDDGDDG